jgi:predicted DNA-binding protein (MmcQ/YjbR family)
MPRDQLWKRSGWTVSKTDKAAGLIRAADQFPRSWEDFPWGERVAKVGKKVFAFLGPDDADERSVSLKLPESCHQALTLDCCEPTGYGLGRAGWVRIQLDRPDCPGLDVLLDWLDESYRAVAPKKLIVELDAG